MFVAVNSYRRLKCIIGAKMKKIQVRKKKSSVTIGGTSQSAFADLEQSIASSNRPSKKEKQGNSSKKH